MKKNIRKIKKPGESTIKTVLQFGYFAFTKPGFTHFSKKAGKAFRNLVGKQQPTYNDWIRAQTDRGLLSSEYERNIPLLSSKPKISILLTLTGRSAALFSNTLDSIYNQLYPYWELCITYSTENRELKRIVDNIQKDNRIKLIPTDSDDQHALLNSGFTNASHNFILLLVAGMLTPDCLYLFAKHIATHPADELVYADEDHINADGSFAMPNFKPGWAPDNLLSRNYIGYPLMVAKTLWQQLDGFRPGYDGNEIYDLLLRATEKSGDIAHIPKVLYHNHTTANPNNGSAKKALEEALQRRNTPGTVMPVNGIAGAFYIQYDITKPGKVSIIIPTKDHVPLLKIAIDSIFSKIGYPDFEVIVINNNSVSPDFFRLMESYKEQHQDKFRCVNAAFAFNFSRLINLGVSESTGQYILMLNNDVEILNEDWLTTMVAHAQHERTGAVGVKLLYPDNTIQHAGIVTGADDVTRHVFVNRHSTDNTYPYYINTTNNYSAVTGACLMCRKALYLEVNGMDEHLPVEYNDVDLCLKFLKKGHYNIYLPMVTLYHYESATRGHPFRSKKAWKQHEKDLSVFRNKWGKFIDRDYFSPDS